jgi:hypothetical protein
VPLADEKREAVKEKVKWTRILGSRRETQYPLGNLEDRIAR